MSAACHQKVDRQHISVKQVTLRFNPTGAPEDSWIAKFAVSWRESSTQPAFDTPITQPVWTVPEKDPLRVSDSDKSLSRWLLKRCVALGTRGRGTNECVSSGAGGLFGLQRSGGRRKRFCWWLSSRICSPVTRRIERKSAFNEACTAAGGRGGG